MIIPIDRGGGGYPPRGPKFPLREKALLFTSLAAILLLSTSTALAQAPRGTLVHEGTLHIAPDARPAKLNDLARGHDLIILGTSRDWPHVQAIISEPRK